MAVAEMDTLKDLLSARTALKASLENSKALDSTLHRTGEKLHQIGKSLPSLEAAARPCPAQKCTFADIRDHVDRALGPASAVLTVHGSIQELHNSISQDPSSHLYAYLASVKKLEEALKFLASNCGLAIQWVEDILQFLEDNSVANEPYVCNVRKSLRILLELKPIEKRAQLDGGVLFAAFTKLEREYRRQLLLLNSSVPVSVAVIEKLQAIIQRLSANNRLSWCTSAYVAIRLENVNQSLQGMDLSYLNNKSIDGSEDVTQVDGWIDQWSNHLESVVKNVLEVEFDLSKCVFANTGPDVWASCFTQISRESGILESFLQFGRKVTECSTNKDPAKLLQLLDIFAALDNLRGDFNRLFGGQSSCPDIRNQTRSLVKSLVDGVWGIFWELTDEVSKQRQSAPPSNGSVPRLVRFVTDYCNELLGDRYRPLLEKVVMIHLSWKQQDKLYQEEDACVTTVTGQICSVVKEIGLNLDSWSKKAQTDDTFYFLFMMNNHCHFSNLRGTKLGDVMGDSWLKGHEQYADYFMALYLRESWGKVISLLRPPAQINSESVEKGLKAFNEAFDYMYRKQSRCVVPDEKLRLRMCKLLVQSVIPVYTSYLQSYKEECRQQKHVKYTTQGMETMLRSLFRQKKVTKYRRNNRHGYWISKLKDQTTTDGFRPTLTAA